METVTIDQVRSTVNNAVTRTLDRQDIPVEPKDVSRVSTAATNAVMAAVAASSTVAMVPVKSPWTSKINVTQAVSAALTLLVAMGLPIDESTKVAILTVTGTALPVLTAVFKTFFSRSISANSK